jgi:hypothetical protein
MHRAVVRESLPVADWYFLSEQEFSRQLAYAIRRRRVWFCYLNTYCDCTITMLEEPTLPCAS